MKIFSRRSRRLFLAQRGGPRPPPDRRGDDSGRFDTAVPLAKCAANENWITVGRTSTRTQALAKVRYRGHLDLLKGVHADLFEIADGATKGRYADMEKGRAKLHTDKQKKENMF